MRFVKILTALLLAVCLTACGSPSAVSKNPETTAVQTETSCPFGDISEDRIRLMAPAYAPYLLEADIETAQILAEAMSTSSWELADSELEMLDGEIYSVFVYNYGQPFRLLFYSGGYAVDYEQGGNVSRYKVEGDAHSVVSNVLHPENPEDITDKLVWCEPENVSVEGVWLSDNVAENEIKLETVEIVPQCKPSMGFEFGLPEDWIYTVVHTDDIPTSSTSAYIIPKSMEGLADGGVLTIEYLKYGFAVCGTGLTEENIDFNGYSARQGFYDGNEQWSYISLNGEYDGCVVHCSPTVAKDYAEIIDAVLPTIKFKYYGE